MMQEESYEKKATHHDWAGSLCFPGYLTKKQRRIMD